MNPEEMPSAIMHQIGDSVAKYIREDIYLSEINKLNNALQQAVKFEEWVYSDEKYCPELSAWLKENPL